MGHATRTVIADFAAESALSHTSRGLWWALQHRHVVLSDFGVRSFPLQHHASVRSLQFRLQHQSVYTCLWIQHLHLAVQHGGFAAALAIASACTSLRTLELHNVGHYLTRDSVQHLPPLHMPCLREVRLLVGSQRRDNLAFALVLRPFVLGSLPQLKTFEVDMLPNRGGHLPFEHHCLEALLNPSFGVEALHPGRCHRRSTPDLHRVDRDRVERRPNPGVHDRCRAQPTADQCAAIAAFAPRLHGHHRPGSGSTSSNTDTSAPSPTTVNPQSLWILHRNTLRCQG